VAAGNIEHVPPKQDYGFFGGTADQIPAQRGLHGSGVAASIIGNKLGVCKSCTLAWFINQPVEQGNSNYKYYYPEDKLAQLVSAFDDIVAKKRQGKAVINMSFHLNPSVVVPATIQRMSKYISDCIYCCAQAHINLVMTFTEELLQKLDVDANAVIVAASANMAQVRTPNIDAYPALFGNPNDVTPSNLGPNYPPLSNIIVVGATDQDTYMWGGSQYAPWMTTL